MNFYGEDKNQEKIYDKEGLAKNIIKDAVKKDVGTFAQTEIVNSPAGTKASIISGICSLVAPLLMLCGLPMVSYTKATTINGPGWGDISQIGKSSSSYSMYNDEGLALVGILLLVFGAIAAIISFTRKNRRPNAVDFVGIVANVLGIITFIVMVIVSTRDNTTTQSNSVISITKGGKTATTLESGFVATALIGAIYFAFNSLKLRKNSR